MHKILLIEDDTVLSNLIKDTLEKYDYQVHVPEQLRHIEEHFKHIKPELVLLDINLPYYDGFYICRAIRRVSSVPIIFISARSGEMDQILGIELGADDYIIKPFSIELLMAKVKSALRRAYGDLAGSSDSKTVIGSFHVDEKSFKLHYKAESVELTKTEFKLIKKLFDDRDKVVSREELLEEMWDESFIAGDNALTVNITRIKGKLSSLGINDAIKTKRGAGYCFDTKALKCEESESLWSSLEAIE